MTEIPRNFDYLESKERSIGTRSGMLSKSAYWFPLCYTNISYSVCFSIKFHCLVDLIVCNMYVWLLYFRIRAYIDMHLQSYSNF